ncbi:MAG: flavin reductase family protein [candidate division WOR-3 bacterium]|nr:flavin reductase family protein [candidate division WOR-3 bacterium]MCX7837019.1 flavin reductase family protein [candidate division WOR-3 bacterium]
MEKSLITNLKEIVRVFACFPCVLVSCSHEGKDNIISIGMVHIFSFNPPLIGIGVAPSRYSYPLIKNSKEFVINIPNKDMVEIVNFCGEKSGKEVDKFKELNLTKEKAKKVNCPLIKECPVNLECQVKYEIETGDHTWFIGEVVACHQAEDYKKEENLLYWGGKYYSVGKIVKIRY